MPECILYFPIIADKVKIDKNEAQVIVKLRVFPVKPA